MALGVAGVVVEVEYMLLKMFTSALVVGLAVVVLGVVHFDVGQDEELFWVPFVNVRIDFRTT